MKTIKYAYFAVLSLAFVACTGGEEKTDLQSLEAKRDSLRQEYQKLATEITSLESSIELEKEKMGIAKKYTVKSYVVKPSLFEHYISVQGVVEADKSVMLNSEAQGSVRAIYAKEGETVKKGQTILAIDTDILDNQIAEAEASLSLTQTLFEKQKKLWNQNIGSEVEYLQSRNNYISLKSRLEALYAQRNKSVVKAPFTGKIDEVMPKIGEAVGPGSPVVRLVNSDKLKVKSEISERYVGEISKGSLMKMEIPGAGETELELDYVGAYINPANRTFKVHSNINNKNGRLLPNMVANLKIRDFYKEEAVSVPNEAILEDLEGNYFVYVISKKNDIRKVEKRIVSLGKSNKQHTLITDGLSFNEEVILEGAKSVNPGDQVAVMN